MVALCGAVAAVPGTQVPRSSVVLAQASQKRDLLLTHNTFYCHCNLHAIEDVLPGWGKTAGFAVTSLQGYKQSKTGIDRLLHNSIVLMIDGGADLICSPSVSQCR